MNNFQHSFTLLDQQVTCVLIKNNNTLTASDSAEIRKAIQNCFHLETDTIFLEAKDVTEIDLGGVNEVIHSHYTLKQVSKKLVFIYRKDSTVEQWVKSTGLDNYIETAIVA